MIDLHSHILPGLDDGAGSIHDSLAMARAAVSEGVQTMVATPHINERYEVTPTDLSRRVGELNLALAREKIPLAVLSGAEVAIPRLAELESGALRGLCLGGNGCLLVESPYLGRAMMIEEALFALELRGVKAMLAHPERCPAFQEEPERLEELVTRGILVCVNAGSLAGRFGKSAERTSLELLYRGVVHAVASDAHDVEHRPPGMRSALEAVPELADTPGLTEYLTVTGPMAVLRGRSPTAPPKVERPQRSPLGRLLRRR